MVCLIFVWGYLPISETDRLEAGPTVECQFFIPVFITVCRRRQVTFTVGSDNVPKGVVLGDI